MMLQTFLQLICCSWSVLMTSLPQTFRHERVLNATRSTFAPEAELAITQNSSVKSPAGCAPGRLPPLCQDTCHEGMFGPNCSISCNCLNSKLCHVITGKCPAACAAGFEGEGCQEPCQKGYFGLGCRTKCHCVNQSDECHHVTGHCRTGCGKDGSGCVLSCARGTYGPGCASTCGHCRDETSVGQCDGLTGRCPSGCAPGWTAPDCKTPCPAGQYGEKCAHLCGMCAAGRACNATSGQCFGGCTPGFMAPFCRHPCPGQGSCSEACSGLECWQDTHLSSTANRNLVIILVPTLGILLLAVLLLQLLSCTHRHFLWVLLTAYRVRKSILSSGPPSCQDGNKTQVDKHFPSQTSLAGNRGNMDLLETRESGFPDYEILTQGPKDESSVSPLNHEPYDKARVTQKSEILQRE